VCQRRQDFRIAAKIDGKAATEFLGGLDPVAAAFAAQLVNELVGML
jgi:hypothetical protein